jgi:hypothetical protein
LKIENQLGFSSKMQKSEKWMGMGFPIWREQDLISEKHQNNIEHRTFFFAHEFKIKYSCKI